MNRRWWGGLAATTLLLSGCAAMVAPVSVPSRRVAVLPPCDAGGRPLSAPADADPSSLGLGEVIVSAADAALRQQGFEVVRLGSADTEVPESAAAAATIARAAGFDGPVLFVRIRRWYGTPDSTLRLDAVLVALDAALVDARSGAVLWQVERPTTPTPLYGSLLLGQAYVVAAQQVMADVLKPLHPPEAG